MPNPKQIEASYRSMLTQVGEYVTVRRYTGSGVNRPKFDATVKARVTNYDPSELSGTIQQGDSHLIVLASDLFNAQFPLPLLTSDKVVIGTKEMQIIAVDHETRAVRNQLMAIEIQARG